MTVYDLLLAVAGLVAATAVGWVIWRWQNHRFNKHVDDALSVAMQRPHPALRRRPAPCACDTPEAPGAHSVARCVPIQRCACRRLHPTAERWVHSTDRCYPAREAIE